MEKERAIMVSIIIPAYNVEKYIIDTLDSVKKQVFTDWECIIVDDCSTDDTMAVIQNYVREDKRFAYIRLDKNSGAAIARNTAINCATGKYLAFLDGDDVWEEHKLDKQIQFMEENGYSFTCTDYGKIDELGHVMDKVVKTQKIYDYKKLLKNCPGNSTVIYDCKKIGKIYADDIKRRNDFVMWLKVIKKTNYAYGLNEILSYHRERSDSISFRKSALVKYQWKVYFEIEKLGLVKSIYYTVYKVIQTILKRNG